MDLSPAVVDVTFQERYWYPDDGGIVWVAGYHVVEPESGRFLARDDPALAAGGLVVAGVAGAARHHIAALESESAAPGERLALRRDADNPHDPHAIAVHLAGGIEEQLGWVPRALAPAPAADLDAGRPWSAVALREQRPTPRDPRSGVTMLLARAAGIELRVHAGGGPRRRG